jgi:hypothetical protein
MSSAAEEKLCNFIKSKTSGKIKIYLESGSKKLSIVFDIIVKPPYYSIINDCIGIDVIDNSYEIISYIHKNSKEIPCFTPRLESNSHNINISIRRTSTDILQVLKSKLILCIPGIKNIYLMDEARINKTYISDYNILRGKDGIYEKYGYKSTLFNDIKEIIKSLKWKDINTIPFNYYYKGKSKKNITLIDYFKQLDKEVNEDESIINIMKSIPFEEDDTNNITSHVISAIITLTNINIDIAHSFILNTKSNEWKKWNSDLKITEFEILSNGGRRQTRRRNNNSKKTINI